MKLLKAPIQMTFGGTQRKCGPSGSTGSSTAALTTIGRTENSLNFTTRSPTNECCAPATSSAKRIVSAPKWQCTPPKSIPNGLRGGNFWKSRGLSGLLTGSAGRAARPVRQPARAFTTAAGGLGTGLIPLDNIIGNPIMERGIGQFIDTVTIRRED